MNKTHRTFLYIEPPKGAMVKAVHFIRNTRIEKKRTYRTLKSSIQYTKLNKLD